MVDQNSGKKYKYLTFKVQAERNKPDAMYAWTYTVTGIGPFEDINILGYYDTRKTAAVVLMSNKNIYEYDWTTVPSRIRSGIFKNYMDLFGDDRHIIIVSDAVSFYFGGAGQGVENAGFKLSHAFEGYTLQFINPSVYSTVEIENLIYAPSEEEERRIREEKLDAEWKKRFDRIPESDRPKVVFEPELKKAEKKNRSFDDMFIGVIIPAAVAIFLLISLPAFVLTQIPRLYHMFTNSFDKQTEIMINTKSTTSNQPAYTDSLFNLLADTTASASLRASADSAYRVNLALRADSIMAALKTRDSVIAELPKEKKVQVELVATIEDGVTTRRVHSSIILDTLRESDIKFMTQSITKMATNMAKDRQAEIDTSDNYYRFTKIRHENALVLEN